MCIEVFRQEDFPNRVITGVALPTACDFSVADVYICVNGVVPLHSPCDYRAQKSALRNPVCSKIQHELLCHYHSFDLIVPPVIGGI